VKSGRRRNETKSGAQIGGTKGEFAAMDMAMRDGRGGDQCQS
jgi:hypothetical protein